MTERFFYNNLKGVSRSLNETFKKNTKQTKRDVSTIRTWLNDASKTGKKLTNDDLKDLAYLLREYMSNDTNGKFVFNDLKFYDKDLVTDIAGYIIESYVYDIIKKHKDVTTKAGRGLKIDKKQIYWDFSITGLDEKFEIKSKCTNGYHQGGFSYTDDQKKDKNLIIIAVKYRVDENSKGVTILIDVDNVNVYRKGFK